MVEVYEHDVALDAAKRYLQAAKQSLDKANALKPELTNASPTITGFLGGLITVATAQGQLVPLRTVYRLHVRKEIKDAIADGQAKMVNLTQAPFPAISTSIQAFAAANPSSPVAQAQLDRLTRYMDYRTQLVAALTAFNPDA